MKRAIWFPNNHRLSLEKITTRNLQSLIHEGQQVCSYLSIRWCPCSARASQIHIFSPGRLLASWHTTGCDLTSSGRLRQRMQWTIKSPLTYLAGCFRGRQRNPFVVASCWLLFDAATVGVGVYVGIYLSVWLAGSEEKEAHETSWWTSSWLTDQQKNSKSLGFPIVPLCRDIIAEEDAFSKQNSGGIRMATGEFTVGL